MTVMPTDIYSVATVREIDRTAIEDLGIPGYTLMTRAATESFSEARRRFPDARRWQVICGAGNNAGDGYVLARLAGSAGIAVSVIALADPDSLTGDAAVAYADFAAGSGVICQWSGDLDAEAQLLVDGILGSGLERDVSGEFAAVVAAINRHPANVVALDIPTGIHGDSGAMLGCAVHADLTVTFVGLKTGLFQGEGPRYCGDVVFAGLEIPAEARRESVAECKLIGDDVLRRHLSPRRRTAHKGDFGHVLVVGGGAGMPGAVRLCAEAALRTGAGRVSIATDPAHAAIIVATRPELMSHGISGAADLEPLLGKADVIAFGPGLGQSPWAAELVAALGTDARPSVWDADALNWLAQSPTVSENRVITPHPGEAGTLLGVGTAAVQHDRQSALRDLQDRFGGVVVLKGSATLISAASGVPWFCASGNPGMASPGMGDVLTGIIASLLAQGLDAEAAAAVGVEVHARAGDRVAASGERGLMASDLMSELRGVINP